MRKKAQSKPKGMPSLKPRNAPKKQLGKVSFKKKKGY